MSSVSINTNELLWRTKGRSWEYCFLLVPEMDQESWWAFYQQVRSELRGGADSSCTVGLFELSNGTRRPFVASLYLDTKNVDASGRATEQFVSWFPNNGDVQGSNVPVNLAQSVSDHFRPILQSDPLAMMTDEKDGETPEQVFRSIVASSDFVFTIPGRSLEQAPVPIVVKNEMDGDTREPNAEHGGRGFRTILLAVGAGIALLGILSGISKCTDGHTSRVTGELLENADPKSCPPRVKQALVGVSAGHRSKRCRGVQQAHLFLQSGKLPLRAES
ncbi:MAG: hypothetical protein P1U87_18105 [Verrucomicrobiales bacterium]|nr:hypothetical protein [Verrucomicrobiales bacterium]